MGWCSGTPIFDAVAQEVLNSRLTNDEKYAIMYALTVAMFDHDWDCESDSEYYKHPIVKKAFKAAAPNVDWDDEEGE